MYMDWDGRGGHPVLERINPVKRVRGYLPVYVCPDFRTF